MSADTRPLLYLDVDGPLNPFAAQPHRRPEGYETHRMAPPSWRGQQHGASSRRVKALRVWLNPRHGARLLTLAEQYELVWATMWEHDANAYIAPRIGLPALPVVEWSGAAATGPDGTFFKTAQLVAHAAGRPFAWVDDEFGDEDRRYVGREHRGIALLHRVDPRIGLGDNDFAALAAWASNPGGSAEVA
jgi:hypothetical protein